MDNIRELKSAE